MGVVQFFECLIAAYRGFEASSATIVYSPFMNSLPVRFYQGPAEQDIQCNRVSYCEN
jgi:hypothetical protein